MLNDSWQMLAFADTSLGFEPIRAGRAVMHDIFALAVTLGGIVLMLLSGMQTTDPKLDKNYPRDTGDNQSIVFHKASMTLVGMYLLGAVM